MNDIHQPVPTAPVTTVPVQSPSESAHHEHHHRRSIGIVLTILAAVIVGAVIYQIVVYGRLPFSRNEILHQAYEGDQATAAAQFFAEHPATPMTDADRKAMMEFFKTYTSPEPTDEQLQQMSQDYKKSQADSYAAWKKNSNN